MFWIAHRGASRLAPENTLSALTLAKAHNATWVEADVMLTQDHVPIIFHDTNLARITGCHRRVASTPYAKIQTLDAGSWFAPTYAYEPIPTLEQYVKTAAALGLAFNLELKATPGNEMYLAEQVKACFEQHWPRDLPYRFSSFYPANLQAIRSLSETAPLGLNCVRLTKRHLAFAALMHCQSIHLSRLTVTLPLVQQLHAAQFAVWVYTVNDLDEGQRLAEWGVEAVFTDDIHRT